MGAARLWAVVGGREGERWGGRLVRRSASAIRRRASRWSQSVV